MEEDFRSADVEIGERICKSRSETRDLGIKWPQWHTLLFEEQVAVCPQDGKKMLLKKTSQELKEGVWLEPIQASLRRKTRELWTDKHRHVTRKLAVERGWVQKKILRHWLVRRKRSVEDVTKQKARRGTGCITARVGRTSETRCQKGW